MQSISKSACSTLLAYMASADTTADAMVDTDQCFTMIMENHGHCHMELEQDTLIGALENAKQVDGIEQLVSM